MRQFSYEDLQKLNHHKQVLFACFCAEQVFHLVEEKHKEVCKKAIEVAYLFLEGKASEEDCSAVANAARSAYSAAAYAASYAARSAVASAYHAASGYAYAASGYAASADIATLEAQWAFYDQLLNGDKYFEQIILLPENKEIL